MSVSVCVGTLVGAIAGVSRGSIDTALVWLMDLFLSLPQVPLLLADHLSVSRLPDKPCWDQRWARSS